jgi:hypothetical protein
VESKWKNYHIITFSGQSLSKTLEEAMDLSQDRLILELEPILHSYYLNWELYMMLEIWQGLFWDETRAKYHIIFIAPRLLDV